MRLFILIALNLISLKTFAEFDCTDLPLTPLIESTFSKSPTEDFVLRDSLPPTEVEKSNWSSCCGTYGPCARPYPKVIFPAGSPQVEWSRERVIAAAKKLIGLPYQHHHLPEMGGLDCSNFTSFVYNYAFGIRISSRVKRQANEAGRLLAPRESLEPGDLLYLFDQTGQEISHALIYLDSEHIIDSTGPGVQIRPFAGRYKDRLARARRVLE